MVPRGSSVPWDSELIYGLWSVLKQTKEKKTAYGKSIVSWNFNFTLINVFNTSWLKRAYVTRY
jgi:hypothetical protein